MKSDRAQEEADAQARLVEKWNAQHPVGIAVLLWLDMGEEVATRTRSPAQLLGGHTAVVWFEGITGCYALSRVTVVS